MGRSLEVKVNQKEITTNKIDIGANGDTILINVKVDGSDDNASFTVNCFNGYWFTYSTERNAIIVNIQKNLSTQERRGSITIEHNCADLSEIINFVQKGVKYTIDISEHYHEFKSVPIDKHHDYDEYTININANNGSQKWYVKEIRQYQVSEFDKFKDDEYNGLISQEEAMTQVRVPYDGVFNYRVEGDSLIVRSYGQIDLTGKAKRVKPKSNPHMRYFFTISHKDADNDNSLYMDKKETYKSQEEKYEDSILFTFDGNDISGYGSVGDGTEKPDDNDIYVFLVNDSKSPIINASSTETTQAINIVSTKNGNHIGYSVQSNNEWCSIDKNIITIKENPSYDGRNGSFTFKQDESNNIIKLSIVQEGY